MPRVSVGKVADLPQGKLVGADIDGEKILVANVGGSFHPMRSTCNHAGGPLHQGKLEGKIVTCPWHGSQWDGRPELAGAQLTVTGVCASVLTLRSPANFGEPALDQGTENPRVGGSIPPLGTSIRAFGDLLSGLRLPRPARGIAYCVRSPRGGLVRCWRSCLLRPRWSILRGVR